MVVHPAPEELFAMSPAWMRSMLHDPIASEERFAPLFTWRNRIYSEHRGSPAA